MQTSSDAIPHGALVVVPARYGSSRFPGKPLALLDGMTVLERCLRRCLEVVPHDALVVATDDDRIRGHVESLGVSVEMTSDACLTGTDRVAEVAGRRTADWFVNVQGDEPFLDPVGLRKILGVCAGAPPDLLVVNAFSEIHSESDFRNPNVPKVVARPDGRLQYISRASIPTDKTLGYVRAHRQVGLYAFRPASLRAFSGLGRKAEIEEIEDIEILRFLELGIDVHMVEVSAPGIAIDTPADLERATQFLRQ
jgi:3-deoxy-manno-octulosonate cytidylyltransferase (CMP-KDO synthetase)